MKPSDNISPVQITKIHIAKSQLGLSEQQYRDILSGFNNNLQEPCKTCKELTFDQAEVLLNIFIKSGWKQTQNGKVKKYEEFAGRPGKFASPAQMRMIEGLWMINSREKTEESMNRFIKRISGKDKIEFITGADAHKIINAIGKL
jgi:phage gp16-like protein